IDVTTMTSSSCEPPSPGGRAAHSQARATSAAHSALSDRVLPGGPTKMKRVPEVLQLAVVIQRGRPSAVEPQLLQELDFCLGGTAAQRGVTKEFPEPRLFLERLIGRPFHELESLGVAGGQPPVEHDLHAEAPEIDIPGFDQRIHEGDAVLD